MDAALLRHAPPQGRTGGYPPPGRQCGGVDGRVVEDGSRCVLANGPICWVVGVCDIFECEPGSAEQLDDWGDKGAVIAPLVEEGIWSYSSKLLDQWLLPE